MNDSDIKKQFEVLQRLPSIDSLLQTPSALEIKKECGAKRLTLLARLATENLRVQILLGDVEYDRDELLRQAEINLQSAWKQQKDTRLHRLINATGVIIHTNLGRAPLSKAARNAMIREASGYCNLEYGLETGKRAKRGSNAEYLLAQLTGAESALIVNNCAAAAILVLTALSKGGEAIVSRGELVEIGGDFRVPDVMDQSGAKLVEVGTTNRTKLSDYKNALTEKSRLIVKVHPSNYKIIGFTETPRISELSELARSNNILLYEDAGSGALIDLSKYGLTDEPLISRSIAGGADVVTFSGDKLLGGPQAGLIVGSSQVIEKLRKHPLYRALRVSKLIYAALEATFESFLREDALENIPVLRMLSLTEEDLRIKTQNFVTELRKRVGAESGLTFEVIEGSSVVGGGSAPNVKPKTSLLIISKKGTTAAQLEEQLRFSKPGVIARILNDQVVIDLRTVTPDKEQAELLEVLLALDENS